MNQIVINQTSGEEYALLEKIGEGSFADVFKGQKVKDKQIVAIKKMRNMRKAVSYKSLRMRRWQKRK
jgi:serine/threonine protein kinase